MKTDHPIDLFLSTGAAAFRVLTGGHQLVGEYRFCALTIKGWSGAWTEFLNGFAG